MHSDWETYSNPVDQMQISSLSSITASHGIFFLFELHFTFIRVKALVLISINITIITILIVVSERVAIDILVQTGIRFRLFTFFDT